MITHGVNCPCCHTNIELETTYQLPDVTCYQEIIESLSNLDPQIVRVMEECHPFIFSKADYKNTEEIEAYQGELDLPFPVISIEVMGEPISIPRDDDPIRSWIRSMIVTELSPKKYLFLIYYQREVDDTMEKGLIPIYEGSNSYTLLKGLVNHYLERLHKEKIGIVGKGQKVKYKSHGQKAFFKPKNLTYVSPKKYISTVSQAIGRHIEWTHRWEVRGTWRKIKGIGKDRSGNYCVQGYTWVVPFVKGPENSPLIKKSRLLSGDFE